MKRKKILLFFAAALLIFTSCNRNTQSEEKTQESMEQKQTFSTEKVPVERKVVNVLHAVGSWGRSSTSVAYLLLDNDSVVVYIPGRGVDLPFSKEEARIIMKVQRGDTVTLTCFE